MQKLSLAVSCAWPRDVLTQQEETPSQTQAKVLSLLDNVRPSFPSLFPFQSGPQKPLSNLPAASPVPWAGWEHA